MAESVLREIARIDHFLRFGSELNVVHFARRSSFLALLGSRDCEAPKARLKCVRNVFESARHNRDQERSLALQIKALVHNNSGRLAPHTLAVLVVTLFDCQRPSEPQSHFRSLAIELFGEFGAVDVLLFCHLMGRKRINASRRIRQTIVGFYSRDFSEKQSEEILVFGKQFDWTHRDVIRLCHVPTNALTAQLMRARGEPKETALELRIQTLRAANSRAHQLVEALDSSQLETRDWFRALNSVAHNNAVVWRKSVKSACGDRLLVLAPKLIQKFPNNKSLFEALTSRLRQSEHVSPLLRALVALFIEKNSNPLKNALLTAVRTASVRATLEEPILVVCDVTSRPYLSSLENKSRRKHDILDDISAQELALLFLRSFRCFRLKDSQMVALDALSHPNEAGALPFASVPTEWRRRVVYVTDEQQELSVWPSAADERLVICHLNRREIKDLSYFRANVLVLNGFDLRWESVLSAFLC